MHQHALLSPSAAERWLNCTRSVRLCEKLPKTTSTYADEGNVAHDLAANRLRYDLGLISLQEYQTNLKRLMRSEYYNRDMDYYVKQYVDFCLATYHNQRRKYKHVAVNIEARVDLSDHAPESFGTSDFNVASNKVLHVVDLKYGQGVPVSANMNAQGMVYALGVYNEVQFLYDIETVEITIFQPRIDNVNTWNVSVDFLLDWAAKVLQPRAKLAYSGEGDFEAGPHCKFCPAKATCKTLAAYNMTLDRHKLQLPELMTDTEIAEVLHKKDTFINWLNSVQDYALDQAKKGTSWPGFKLVEGRSNRTISDEAKAKTWLIKQGYTASEVLENRLLPITKLEKVLAKGELQSFEQRFVTKPKGAPTLVPVTDRRPAISSAAAAVRDFENLLK